MSVLGNNLFAAYYAQQETLPKEYRRVEYLESAGTQYIDTGFKLNSTCKVLLDIYNLSIDHNAFLFGGRSSTNLNTYACVNLSTTNAIRFDYGKKQVSHSPLLNIGRHVIIKDKINNYIDDIFVSANQDDNFSCKVSSFIFTVNTNRTPDVNMFIGRVFSHKIWDNELKRNFIPCIRKSDGKPGLYDLCGSICPLTNTPFYINAGTGEFVIPT